MTSSISPPRIVTLILLTGLSTLSLNMFLPSLSNIAETFQADYGLVSLSIAGYLGMTALMQLIVGPLSDRFGRRPVLLIALVIFIFASVGCLVADNITTFLIFRMVQAAIVSGAALSSAIVCDMHPAKEAASLLGYINMVMAIAPMLGPLFGGILDELFGWRASFVAFVGIGIFILGLCVLDLGETNETKSANFKSQMKLYPELLGSRRFWGYSLCRSFSVGAFFTFLAGVPLVATTLFSMSTSALGFYMGTITLGFFCGSFLSGRYAKFYRLSTMMIAGTTCGCLALLVGITLLLFGFVHEFSLFGATIFVGLGNGLSTPSSSSGAMSVKPELAGSAASLSGALTVGGGGLLTSVAGAVLTEQNGPIALLGMMLVCSSMGLLAALSVRWIDAMDVKTV